MPADSDSLAEAYLPQLRRTLRETVIEFWYPRSIDEEHGGYITSYDETGEFAGNDGKMLVIQARMVWFFSRLHREGYGDGEFREAAEQGVDFLLGELRDHEHGGFYWEAERDGTVTKPNKHMYGQAFALYGLSEYYRSTGDETAREHAIKLFELFESEAHDEANGGYVEYFEPDWTPVTTGGTYLDNIEPDWSPKEDVDAELDAGTKLTNTHLHLLEAFTTFYRATGHEKARERLNELLTINTNTIVRKDLGACTDKYAPDWRPLLDDESYRIVSYGHDIEGVWLTMEAADALEMPLTYYRDLYETLWGYSLTYGYDDDRGGFYFYGPFEEPATSRVKAWWVQAEALVSALRMYELTDEPAYREVFEETYAFLDEHQIDREYGEWHSGVTDDGETVGRKGAVYKGAYHSGRALLECINALERLEAATEA
ncbi:AGE family epimerase/isomerase [Halosimplex sp. J119]